MHIAANPRRARNLVGTAITHTRADGTPATKTYTSFDGGQTWTDTVFAEQMNTGGGDPQVAFTPHGTALFTTLNSAPDDLGRTRAFLHVYRSEDGGRTWSKPTNLGASYDHENIAVDQSTGRFAGRIYISALYGAEYQLGVFRSDDDGRSFIGPVEFYRSGGKDLGVNVLQMGVFSDGTLLATFHDFALQAKPGQRRSGFFTVTSDDGGITFSKPRQAPDEIDPPNVSDEVRLAGDAGIAIDTSPLHRDRLYRVWNDGRTGQYRIYISTSDDRGTTWSEPRAIDMGAPAQAQQFLPSIAINGDGIVAVKWQDTRDAGAGETAYSVYFTASSDGGRSFLSPVRISTEISRPYGAGNLAVTPLIFVTPGDGRSVLMSLLSAGNRWPNGGDYSGMVADADGVFHPFWADSRTGSFQVMTARVRFDDKPSSPQRETIAAAAAREEADVTSRIEFINDPSKFDAAANELELRIRLKNISDRPIGGPLTLTIKKFDTGLSDAARENVPTVVNAANQKQNDGATFIYDESLGSERLLEPGSTSGTVLLRLRLKNPLRRSSIQLTVSGFVVK